MSSTAKDTVKMIEAISRLVSENIGSEVRQEVKIGLASAIAIGINQYLATKEEPESYVHTRVMTGSIHNTCNQCDSLDNRHRLPKQGHERILFKLGVLIQRNDGLLPFMSVTQYILCVDQQKLKQQQEEFSLTSSWE